MRVALPYLRILILLGSLLTPFGLALGQAGNNSPQQPPPAPTPQLIGEPIIIINRDTHSGSEDIQLRGATKPGSLSGSLTSAAGVKSKVTFTEKPAGTEKPPGTEKPAGTEPIRTVTMKVTDVDQAGEFDADLAYDGANFAKVKIMYPPFAVTLDEADPNRAGISLVNGQIATLTLKNDDPVEYSLLWRLNVGGNEVCKDQLTLPAKGIGLVQCRAHVPLKFASIQDLFKVESTDGNSLQLFPSSAIQSANPWKQIPVKASLSYFSAFSQQFWGYVAIIAVLILGGLTSLVLSQALPNRLRRLNIRERLDDLARQTANLTGNIGSRLQVLLRLDRNSLEALLGSRNVFSPDFAGIAARCNDGTTKLEARVALAQQIDVAFGRLEQKLALGPPPSQIATIEGLLEDAKVLLAKTQATDKDLDTAQTAITEAARRCDLLNQPDEVFGQALAKRVTEIANDITTNFANDAVFKKLDAVLPGPYKAVQRVSAGTLTILPVQYAELDMAVEKLRLLKEFVVLYEGSQDPEMLKRLDQNLPKLLGYLQLQSWSAMRSARLLMRQMKDDVYSARVGEVLVKKLASINVKPMRAYHRGPLELAVAFQSDALENAAAREEWTCQWAFGDQMNETGWSVSHYFELDRRGRFRLMEPKDFPVTTTFLNGDGEVLIDPATQQPVTLEKQVSVAPSKREQLFGDRARTELVKLVAALFIAVFALVSGAREQLMKLDILPGLIAVFTIGFGADTIKTLLTKSDTTP